MSSIDRMTGRAVPGTPAWLRTRNDSAALQLLLDHGALTRNRLGELTGLSKPTASQMVQRLESAGLIQTSGVVAVSRGPGATAYSVRTDQVLGVAIDIDAHSIHSRVADVTGTDHPVATSPLPRGARSAYDDVQHGIAKACAAAGIDTSRIDAVCIGVQGAIDLRADELRFNDTLDGWLRSGVHSYLERRLGMAVTIENDVKLAAIAERRLGAGKGLDGFTLLWLGDGLGLATDVGGTLQRGISGSAGEIGYLPVPRAAAVFDPEATELQDLIGEASVIALTTGAGATPATYYEAVRTLAADDAVRARVMTALAPRIALGIVPVLAVLDPERVVIGGPTGALGGTLLADAVAAEVRRTTQWDPDVVTSAVTDRPVLAGAHEKLVDSLRQNLFERLDRLGN